MSDAFAQQKFSCPTCGAEMVKKSKLRLISVGVLFMALIFLTHFAKWFWAPGIILFLTGIYLIVWATLGHARWCRNCKRFPSPMT